MSCRRVLPDDAARFENRAINANTLHSLALRRVDLDGAAGATANGAGHEFFQ